MNERRKLTDILHGNDQTNLRREWQKTEAATDYTPLPAGTYTARIASGELCESRHGTPGYKLAFVITDGEHTDRQLWYDCWLTAAALPLTKRDLSKLGITSIDQLDKPLPSGIHCQLKVSLRRDDDGNTHNRIKTFTVTGIAEATPDTFAPDDTPASGNGDGCEKTETDDVLSFDPARLESETPKPDPAAWAQQ